MGCTKCWYINERDHPYREDVWGKLSQGDVNDLNETITSLEHDADCKSAKS